MKRKISPFSLLSFVVSILQVQSCSTLSQNSADLTIINARLYAEPGALPIEAANISISDGKITAIYTGAPISSDLIIEADGRTATAGLWNSHVHFTDPQIMHASERIVSNMLLKYGFTTVIDAGSELQDTLTLKKRIEDGLLPGPKILAANGSFVFKDGTPSYLPGITLPEIERAEEAGPLVASVLDSGADGIKIFSGSFQSQSDTIHLPPDVIRAVANATHSHGSFVFSHPTDRTGLTNAVENGVDVLAHTAPTAGSLGPDLIATMKRNNVALIPTLKLWAYELGRAGVGKEEASAFQRIGVAQLAEYFAANGEILFGTDVGFMDEFDTEEEFELMHAAGMEFDDILASMTTAPSHRFSEETGSVVVGAPADIVIFKDDPSLNVTAFSQVAFTIVGGRLVYRSD